LSSSNTATTFTCELSGGSDNLWQTDDVYWIQTVGAWYDGVFRNPLVKFTNTTYTSVTNPSDVISTVLQMIGIPYVNIDGGGSFMESKTDFNTHVVLCGEKRQTFNSTFWMLQSSLERLIVATLIIKVFPKMTKHNILVNKKKGRAD